MKARTRNETLIAARKQSGKTQAQVAKETEIAMIAYQTYERGTRTPSAITGNKIARVLGTTSEALWGYGDTEVL